MNLKFQIIDSDTGQIKFSGLLTSYSMTLSRYGHTKFEFEGTSVSRPVERMGIVEESSCDHKWKKYEGIIESYDYCEICSKKRDISTDPRFRNTYAEDSWRTK